MQLLPLYFVAVGYLSAALAVVQVPIQRTVVTGVRSGEGSVVEYHTVNVAIGTPPKAFNLTLDSGAYYAYVFTPELHDSDCKEATSGTFRRRFEPHNSTTYRNIAKFEFAIIKDEYINYCVPAALQFFPFGLVGRDVVTLSGVTATTSIALVEQVINGSLQTFWPSDGILGLLRNDRAYPTSTTTLVDLATAAGVPTASLYFGKDTTDRSGVLTLGGVDAVNCDTKWTWFSQSASGMRNWHVSVASVQMGRYARPSTTANPVVAVLDTGTKTLAPTDVFSRILVITGAEYDFASDEYVVACSAVKSLPDLVLTFTGGFEYRIPAVEYAKNLAPRNDLKCTLLISELPDDNTAPWRFGWQTLRSYCWSFDYDANAFGLAKPKH